MGLVIASGTVMARAADAGWRAAAVTIAAQQSIILTTGSVLRSDDGDALMTVVADDSSYPLVHDGVTYYFCRAGCRRTFEADPAAYVEKGTRC